MNDELQDAILAAQDFRDERDIALAEVARLQAQVKELEKRLAEKPTVKYLKKSKKPGPVYPMINRQKMAHAARMIGKFPWRSTKQGHAFWAERHAALLELADGAAPVEDWEVEKASNALTRAFHWEPSPQGDEFWRLAYNALEEMGK